MSGAPSLEALCEVPPIIYLCRRKRDGHWLRRPRAASEAWTKDVLRARHYKTPYQAYVAPTSLCSSIIQKDDAKLTKWFGDHFEVVGVQLTVIGTLNEAPAKPKASVEVAEMEEMIRHVPVPTRRTHFHKGKPQVHIQTVKTRATPTVYDEDDVFTLGDILGAIDEDSL